MRGISSKKIVAVDLFCGAGGLTYGLQKEGIDVSAGIDIDETCQYPYEKNNHARFFKKDVATLTKKEVSPLFKRAKIKVLVGCAPCQPFSGYARGMDERWMLLRSFAHLIKTIKPEILSMENIPQLASFQNGHVFKEFEEVLTNSGYHIHHQVVYAPDYGIPQMRKRLVLLASRLGPIKLISPTQKPSNYPTTREAIGRLPKIGAGAQYEGDFLHKAASLSPVNIKRLKASIPGGTWKDWPKHLILPCHKRLSGKSGFLQSYGRMKWDEPAPTLTTRFYSIGCGRYCHPEQNRGLSLREGALLQGFPRDYVFAEDKKMSITTVARMIGNAVPVPLARAIGRSIKQHITQHI